MKKNEVYIDDSTVETGQPVVQSNTDEAKASSRTLVSASKHKKLPIKLTQERIDAFRNLDKATSSKNLESYYTAISKIQVLTVEEENTLALNYQEHGDLEAARLLVLSNLRFVAHIAKTYSGYGLPRADLIQEGNVGLVKAVKLFDPRKKKGARLISFAVHWIKSEIQEYILQNWRLVKVATTKHQRKLFYNLRSSKKTPNLLTNKEATEIADDLAVSVDEVYEMEKRLTRVELPYEEVMEDEFSGTRGSVITASDNVSEEIEEEKTNDKERKAMMLALEKLEDRDRRILQMRWMSDKKVTLSAIADKFKISIERVRQIEAEAIRKLKALVELEMVNQMKSSKKLLSASKITSSKTK